MVIEMRKQHRLKLNPSWSYSLVTMVLCIFQVRDAYGQSIGADLFGRSQSGEQGAQVLRYTPRIEYSFPEENDSWKVFAEGHLSYSISGDDDQSIQEFNRLWLRYTQEEWSLRLGRQKVNFGPARLIRPLQWFDQLDPTDLIPFTRGVNGILAKFYTPSNHTIWLWSFRDERVMAGNSVTQSDKDRFASGGRLEISHATGEYGLSYLRRPIELADEEFYSQHVGFDASWDLGFGLWVEAAHEEDGIFQDQILNVVLGSDYTFDWGSGLYASLELNHRQMFGQDSDGIAGQIQYPLSFIEAVNAYGNWSEDASQGLVEWSHTLDQYIWGLGVFYRDLSERNPQAGLQVTGQWTH